MAASPLQPEDNSRYWSLLLTEEFYLLPEDIQKPAVTQAAASVNSKPQPSAQAAKVAQSAQEAGQPNLVFGKNLKEVLILVEDSQYPVMSREDGLFLKDILKAINYSFDDVAIVNISKCTSAADWEYLKSVSWTKGVSFGVSRPELSFTAKSTPYELQLQEDRTFFYAESLATIRQQVESKKRLWNLLRQVFV